MEKVFQLARHRVALTGNPDHPVWQALTSYAPFEIPAGKAENTLTLELAGSLPEEAAELVFSSRDEGFPRIDLLRAQGGSWQILTAPSAHSPICARISCDEDFSRASLLVEDPTLSRFSLDNALMILFALRTATLGTLEMHASTVICEGKGYLFLGKSGTGKSTHSRLWLENIEGCELLNDDNPLLTTGPDGIRVHGSPWSGKTPCYKNREVPVGAIVRIRQAPENSIRRLSLVEAYACIYPSCSGFRPLKEIADGLHRSIAAAAAGVPCYELGCLPDADAARLCHETVTGIRTNG